MEDRDSRDLPTNGGVGPVVWLLYSKSRLRSCAEDSYGEKQISKSLSASPAPNLWPNQIPYRSPSLS